MAKSRGRVGREEMDPFQLVPHPPAVTTFLAVEISLEAPSG
jgi:hypothetical protein